MTIGFLIANRSRFVDYQVYYYAGGSLLGGRTDLYSPTFSLGDLLGYRYPPLFLLLVCPLSLLPYTIAAYVWWMLCFAQELGCIYYVRGIIRDCGASVVST